MRAHLIAKTARLTSVTGLALAISSVVLAGAAAADTTASPSPSATPTVAPTPTRPALDAGVTARTTIITEIPRMAIVRFTVRSDRPTASYRLVLTSKGLDGWAAPPNHANWDCTGGAARFDCTWTGPATTEPNYVSLAYGLPDRPGATATGTVTTTEPDRNQRNNKVVVNVARRGTPTPAPTTSTPPTASKGTITGRVWHDTNGNGRQDRAEKGIAGAKVLLSYAVKGKPGTPHPELIGPVTTGADGRYLFGQLAPHVPGKTSYAVIVSSPNKDWKLTKPGIGAERGDSDFQPMGSDPMLEGQVGGGTLGFLDQVDVRAGRTTVLDAGYVKLGGGVPAGNSEDDDTLPKTGAAAGGLLGAGVLLLGGGVALTLIARRRRGTIVG